MLLYRSLLINLRPVFTWRLILDDVLGVRLLRELGRDVVDVLDSDPDLDQAGLLVRLSSVSYLEQTF